MTLFDLNKYLSDGRVMRWHTVRDRQVDFTTFTIRVIIRSWQTELEAKNKGVEFMDFFVDIEHEDYDFSYLDDLETQVLPLTWKLLNNKDERIKTFDELKLIKNSEIDAWRGIARYGNVATTIDGIEYTWQADRVSQELLSDAISFAVLGVQDAPPQWRSLDNVDVVVSLENLKEIASAMAQQTSQAYYHSWELKALVNAAINLEELEAITW